MNKIFENNFRYTTDRLLDTVGGAIVAPVNMFGGDVTYPFARISCIPEMINNIREWRHRPHQLVPAQTKIVKHEPAGDLKFDWVIYTVLPFYNNDKDWFILCDCYRNCLEKAAENGITSVAFPLMGRGQVHYRPEGDLLFYVSYILNDTIERLGGKEKIDVSVQIPSDLLDCLQNLEEIINRRSASTMYYKEAKRWIDCYEGFIYSDEIKNKPVISNTPARFRKESLEYDVDEYCSNFLKRSQYIGDLIREYQRKKFYDDMVNRIKSEKEAFLTAALQKDPEANPDLTVKRFRCRKIDGILQKWYDKPVPEKDRVKNSRKNYNQNMLADIVGISSTSLSNISGKTKIPARETLLALAVGMKLPYEERLELCLYRDENIKYPSTEKEKLIERLLEETGYIGSDMSFAELNLEVNNRSGGKFSIYENKNDAAEKESVKKKKEKTKAKSENR